MKHPFDINRAYLPQWIRLDQSENPYGFSFNRYPSQTHEHLLYDSYLKYIDRDLGQACDLTSKNMLFTRGAADGIDLILRTFGLSQTKNIAVTDPTFFPILHWAHHYGLNIVTEKLSGPHLNRLNASAFHQKDLGLCFLINPNNPTTTCLDPDNLLDIISNFKGLVVVNEAYIDFCHARSVIDKIVRYPNLIVLRSMSKAWGCAGLRAGFIIANADIIDALRKIQPPFMCDVFTCDHLTFLLNQRYSDYCHYRSLLIESRDALIQTIDDSLLFNTLPSQTNFIVIQGENLLELEHELNAQAIQFKKIRIQEDNYLKISIGNQLETSLIKNILNAKEACVSTIGTA